MPEAGGRTASQNALSSVGYYWRYESILHTAKRLAEGCANITGDARTMDDGLLYTDHLAFRGHIR
jgi:hypothetical protein